MEAESKIETALGKINFNLVIWAVLLFIVYKVVTSLFAKGEGEKTAEATEKKGALDFKKYISNIKKTPKGFLALSLSTSEITQIAKGIWLEVAKTYLDDSHVLSLLKEAGTKGDIVVISKTYSQATKRDLYADLKKRLSDSNQADIFSYINRLPDSLKTT